MQSSGGFSEVVIKQAALIRHQAEMIRSLSGNPRDEGLASGRTTRLILRAMIALSEGHDVLVVAHTLKMAEDLRRKIIERCRSWRIPIDGGGTPRLLARVPNDDRRGFRGVVLVDHKVIEDMEASA